MFRPLLLTIFLFLVGGPASGQEFGPGRDRNDDGCPRPPGLPPVEEVLQATGSPLPGEYPRLVAQIQYGLLTRNLDQMERSFADALAIVGLPTGTSLEAGARCFTFALGVRFSSRLALLGEGFLGGGGTNIKTANHWGLMPLLTLTSPRNRSLAVNAGLGAGFSRLEVREYYGYELDTDHTLEYITWHTGWQTVVPVTLQLEIPNPHYHRFNVVMSFLATMGGESQGMLDLSFVPYQEETITAVQADGGGWFVALGLAIGL